MIKPFGSRVVIEMDKSTDSKVGNIIINSTAKEPPTKATVLSLGPEVGTVNEITSGDRILIPKEAGIEVELEGKKYVIIEEKEILAKIGNK